MAHSGSISYDVRATSAGQSKSLSQLVTTSLAASTYLYQPWLATVSGTVRFTTGHSRWRMADESGAGVPGPVLQLDARDRFISGEGRLALFPRSRFPFDLDASRSDSRIDGALASPLDFRTQVVRISQRYSPVSSAYRLSGSLERREQEAGGRRDRQNAVNGTFDTRWKHHDVSLALAASQARHEAGESSRFQSLVARHHYTPAGGQLSVSTSANLTSTHEDALEPLSAMSVLQASSTALWQPVDTKLRLTGSARAQVLRESVRDYEAASVGLSAGAAYDLRANVQLNGHATFTASETAGAASRSLGASGGIGWQADAFEFKGLRYDRSASGTVSFMADDTGGGGAAANVAGLVDHRLSWSRPLADQSLLTLSAAQSLTGSYHDSGRGARADEGFATTLLHALALTWSASRDTGSVYARASYNDSIRRSGGQERVQLANFQFSGKVTFGRYRSLEGDLTGQHMTQRSADSFDGFAYGIPTRSESSGLNGQVTFREQRLFGVPRLQFSSRLVLAQDVLRQPGTLSAIPDRETKLWENRLEWGMGRLHSQFLVRVSHIDSRRQEFVMWRVRRNF